ncbi:hypothetical protein AMECASPLE_000389 [Ameca splendens]|uniref:Uncharacterized protein n=1 Tax=Ameca splendens TaxID=208324 RepID=A0ABV0Y9A5_9TELE
MCLLLPELTHEFLQILERTPSKLKRIRNWRAIQAAKKPKTEGSAVESAFQGTSLDGLPGVTTSFFPSTSTSNSSEMSVLSSIAAPYPMYQQLSDQFPQPAHSDFTLVKHKHKAAAGSSSEHEQLGMGAATFPRPQKVLTLEKYRVKQAGDMAMQNGVKEELGAEVYAPPAVSSHHHKRRSQQQQAGQSGDGRREKASSKKPRLTSSYAQNGTVTGEEFKMRIKVSSEQGGTLSGKDKHKEHSGHRHSKHSHSHSYSLSGNSRGTTDGASFSVRASSSHFNDGSSSSSSRKRQHADAGSHNHHHHHSSKSSRSSKGGLGSAHYSSDSGQRTMELHSHDGTNGMLLTNGQHTDYKNTFDMLDSLLSAQGMNL